MATFEKKTWTDRVSEYPTRRTLTYPASGVSDIVTVERNEGQITNQGDAFNATNMNDLESRIDTCIRTMNSNFQAGVDAVYAACVAEGVTPSASSPTAIAAAIADIRSGGTAQAAHILNPYTAYSSKVLRTGSMVNRGAWTSSTSNDGRVTIPQGYHNGSGYVNFTGRSVGRAEAGVLNATINGSTVSHVPGVYIGSEYANHWGVYMCIFAREDIDDSYWPTLSGTIEATYAGNLIDGQPCRAIWLVFKTGSSGGSITMRGLSYSLHITGQRAIILGPCV